MRIPRRLLAGTLIVLADGTAGWVLQPREVVGRVAVAVHQAPSHHASRKQVTPAAIKPTPYQFSITMVSGQTVTVPDSQPTLIYFMSATCSSCAAGENQLAQLFHQEAPGARFLSLDISPSVDSAATLEHLASSIGASWPHALASPTVLAQYHVSQLETVAIISPTGQLVYEGHLPSNTVLQQWIQQAGPA